MVLRPDAWKTKTIELTKQINKIKNDYESILNDWESVRDEAGDPGKHEVDECFNALSDARSKLCGLRGGSLKRKHRRTRKHRR